MKILFAEPAKFFAEESMNKTVKQTPHIGLAYVATATQKYGHEVKVLDVPAKDISLEHYLDMLKAWEPEVVGFTAMTHNIKDVYEYAKKTLEVLPDATTVVGGPHANAVKDQILTECNSVNTVYVGEGELTFPKMVSKIHNRVTVYGEPITNLDDLQFPDWRLFDYKNTYAKAYSYKFREMRFVFPVQTMRGCPHRCVFCFPNGLGHRVRFRSAESIFQEIKRVIDEYDASFFYLSDSNSTLNHPQMTKLCQLLIDEDLDIALKGETSVNHVNKKLLTLMKRAGFELIFFGIESGDEYVQKKIQKRLTLSQIRKAVSDAKSVGLKVSAGFILGLPYDTIKSAQDTIRFAESLPLDRAVFSLLDVYPSTQLELMVKNNEGGLRYVNNRKPAWDELGRTVVNMEVNDLTSEVLKKLFNEASHIVHPDSIDDALHKFFTEHDYYLNRFPSAVDRHVRNYQGLLERALQ